MTEEQKMNAQEVEAEVIVEEEETKVETNLDKVVNKVTSFIKKHKTTILVSGLTGITGYVIGKFDLFGNEEDELISEEEDEYEIVEEDGE